MTHASPGHERRRQMPLDTPLHPRSAVCVFSDQPRFRDRPGSATAALYQPPGLGEGGVSSTAGTFGRPPVGLQPPPGLRQALRPGSAVAAPCERDATWRDLLQAEVDRTQRIVSPSRHRGVSASSLPPRPSTAAVGAPGPACPVHCYDMARPTNPGSKGVVTTAPRFPVPDLGRASPGPIYLSNVNGATAVGGGRFAPNGVLPDALRARHRATEAARQQRAISHSPPGPGLVLLADGATTVSSVQAAPRPKPRRSTMHGAKRRPPAPGTASAPVGCGPAYHTAMDETADECRHRVLGGRVGQQPRDTTAHLWRTASTPGPGHFQPKPKGGPAFTMGRRLRLPAAGTPGPGDYDTVEADRRLRAKPV